MRTVEIRCDRCGNIISEKPVKILIKKVQREGPHLCSERMRGLDNLEFCEQCAVDIKRFAIQPLYETAKGIDDETSQDT